MAILKKETTKATKKKPTVKKVANTPGSNTKILTAEGFRRRYLNKKS